MCLEDGIGYASDFLRRGLGREPNMFFAGYVPAGGKEDAAWKDKKKGKIFNQIDISGIPPDSARLYLNSLVRAQIDAYPQSLNKNPFYAGRYTADLVDFDLVRAALQRVCDQFRSFVGAIVIPSKKDKLPQGFTNMTTVGLLSLRPGGKDTPAVTP